MTMRLIAAILFSFGCAFIWIGAAHAQLSRIGGDWTTSGADAQRSSWVRTDAKISKDSVQKPDFQLVWKVKLRNEPRQLNALTPPVLLDRHIGYRGFRALGFLSGSSDSVFALDTDLSRIEWQNPFTAATSQRSSLDCPGGMTANVARPTTARLPSAAAGRGFGGRGGPARSAVGESGQGAVTVPLNQPAFPAPTPTEAGPAARRSMIRASRAPNL